MFLYISLILQVLLLDTLHASNFPTLQLNSLKELYESTRGVNWLWRPVSFGSKWDFNGAYVDPCKPRWQGINCSVECYSSTSHGCGLTSLNLSAYNMTGTLPNSIGNLTTLLLLDFSFNPLFGTIPSTIGQLLSLEQLYLNGIDVSSGVGIFLNESSIADTLEGIQTKPGMFDPNDFMADIGPSRRLQAKPGVSFDGSIPWEIGNLRNLTVFDASANSLVSCIPSTIYKLTKLRVLNLALNLLTGMISTSIGNLQRLTNLLLSDNGFHGTIPTKIGQLNSLVELSLAINRLQGGIPREIGKLRNIELLQLYGNNLNGTIPTEIGYLNNMLLMDIGFNKLSGTIPPAVYNFSNMRIFSVAHNNLVGSMPRAVGNLSNILTLALCFNSLGGTIPSEIGLLTTMSFLLLLDNAFTGPVPLEFYNLTSLLNFDFGYNFLTGTISPSVVNLMSMVNCSQYVNTSIAYSNSQMHFDQSFGEALFLIGEYFAIADNYFSGSLPSEMENLQCLSYFVVAGNFLDGTIPERIFRWPRLSALEFDNNMFFGTLPSQLGCAAKLSQLTLSHNLLTGTIPQNFLQCGQLLSFEIGANRLTGTIPTGLGNCTSLQTILLYENSLQGSLPSELSKIKRLNSFLVSSNRLSGSIALFSEADAFRYLSAADLSDNTFTGTIPSELFALRRLESLSLNKNCFRGTLPDSLCSMTQPVMSALMLNGLSSGDYCRNTIFSIIKTFTAKYLSGSIPTCLFSVSSLQSLQVSGNGFLGTLPNLAYLPFNLVNLSLSHNRMTGIIPPIFTSGSLNLLDLSNNQFRGSFAEMSNFYSSHTNKPNDWHDLRLVDNRLSGNLPGQFLEASAIDILSGNLVGCMSRSELPINDPNRDRTGCGAAMQGFTLIAFGVLWGMLIAGLWVALKFQKASVQAKTLEVITRKRSSTNADRATGIVRPSVTWQDVHKDITNIRKELEDFEVKYFLRMLATITRTAVNLLLTTIFVIIPVYLGLKIVKNGEYKSHEFQYALYPSMAYLYGFTPSWIVFTLYFVLSLFAVLECALFSKDLRKSMRSSIRNMKVVSWKMVNFFYSSHSTDVSSIPLRVRIGNFFVYYRIPLLNAAFILVDIVVITIINGSFVYTILTQSENNVLAAEFCLALVKVVWNNILMPICMEKINRVNEKELVGGGGHGNTAATSTLPTTTMLLSRSLRLDVQISLGIFNILISPLMCLLVDGDNCFLHTFINSNPIISTSVYKVCYVLNFSGSCFNVPHILTASFVPPFVYSFQCSSEIIRDYVAVYVIMYVYTAVIGPVINFLLAFIVLRSKEDGDCGTFDLLFASYCNDAILKPRANCESNQVQSSFSILAHKFGTSIGFDDSESSVAGSAGSLSHSMTKPTNDLNVECGHNSTIRVENSKEKNSHLAFWYLVNRTVQVDKFVSKVVVDVAVLVTFGFAYPPLGIVICVSVIAACIEWRMLANRCCQMYDSRPEYQVYSFPKIRSDGIVDYLSRFQWLIISLMCWFGAYFIFDFSSGQYEQGAIACVLLLLWPAILWISSKVISRIWPKFSLADEYDKLERSYFPELWQRKRADDVYAEESFRSVLKRRSDQADGSARPSIVPKSSTMNSEFYPDEVDGQNPLHSTSNKLNVSSSLMLGSGRKSMAGIRGSVFGMRGSTFGLRGSILGINPSACTVKLEMSSTGMDDATPQIDDGIVAGGGADMFTSRETKVRWNLDPTSV